MKKRSVSLLLVVVMLLTMIPGSLFASAAEVDAREIYIDFKAFAKEASEQDWYADLATVKTVDGHDTKRASGATRGTGMTMTEKAAYQKMLAWMEQTQDFVIDESKSQFDSSSGNRLYLCPDDEIQWGLGHNTYYRGTTSSSLLALTVTVPWTGTYRMSFENVLLTSSSKDVPEDGWDHGDYGYMDIYVNDVMVYDDYRNNGYGVAEVDLGLVELTAGENSICIYAAENYVGNTTATPCCNFNLKSMTFKAEDVAADVVVDFKEFARQAQKQSFWKDLPSAVDENTVFLGRLINNSSVTSTQKTAYAQMVTWGKDTFGWTIDESISGFNSFWKRLYLNGQDSVPWGFSMYTYYHAAYKPERSKLGLTITAPADGWYEIDLSVFKENSTWSGSASTIGDGSSGGDTIAVYVNDQLVITDYSLEDKNISVTDDIGACWLNAGENTVVIDSLLSYSDTGTDGRSNIPLQKMVFKPLWGVDVQEYLTVRVPLLETYLPFSTDPSVITVESADPMIAEAAVNANGVLIVTGRLSGAAEVYVKLDGELVHTIPVYVAPFDGTLDQLQGSATRVDFMTFADRAAEQTWWAPTDDRMTIDASHAEARKWLSNNVCWNVTDGAMVVNGGSEKYGVAVNESCTIEVEVPASGLYNLDLQYLAGGDDVLLYINGQKLGRGADTAGSGVSHVSFGAVELEKGSNTVKIVSDEVKLRGVTLTPLGTFHVEVGRDQYIDLKQTYLAHDDDVSSYEVSCADTCVSIAQEGSVVIVSGLNEGNATILLQGEETHALTVAVQEKSPIARLTYTVDGFRAETLSVGETAEGRSIGMTTGRNELPEAYLANGGNVYYLSSDPKVVAVDQATGDVSAIAEGTAIITAYVLLDGVIVKDLVTVVVTDDTDLQSVEVFANVNYVGTGNTLQMELFGVRASGAAADMARFPVTWTLDDDTLASIDETGLLTGLAEGVVTVTAAACVEGMPISDTMQIRVVDNAVLPTRDIILQMDQAKVLDWQALSFATHGFRLNKEKTYKGGMDIRNDTQGPAIDVPAGGALAFDFEVKQSGWYQAYTQGKSLVGSGGMCYVYVDDSYVGFMDGGKSNSNSDAGGKMDTVWLEAGIHTIEIVAEEACWIRIGRAIFYPTMDPRSVDISLRADKTELVVGESTEMELVMYDQNGEKWHLLQKNDAPDHTNYYILENSDPKVISVNGSTVQAQSAGTAVLTVRGEAAGEPFTTSVAVTVKTGSFAGAELTAERTTLLPDAAPFALTLTTYNADGSKQTSVPAAVKVSYQVSDSSIAAVSANGIVTLTGKTGSALVTAVLTEGDRTTEVGLWISVNAAKTEPTVYTYEKRANAQENVKKYSWANSLKQTAVKNADLYVEHLDEIYDMWIPNTFPRTTQVGFRGDEGYRYCRYCGVDLVAKYDGYPYSVDPIEKPWKITCPACKRDFPSNDFESYYKSGLDQKGQFHKELADPKYLVNELYPEMGEGWGVDDGFGYFTKDASGAEVCHTYIAFYLGSITTGLSGDQKHNIGDILTALMDAYCYTGDEKYGSAGAILIDRLADIYPDMDIWDYDWKHYATACALSGRGKFLGLTWDATQAITYARAVDAFWPAAENTDVVDYLKQRAVQRGDDPDVITPEYLRTKAEDNILMEIFRAAENGNIEGNFGMSEGAVAYAAHALDRLPESKEMVEWIFATEEFSGAMPNYHVAGGDVSRTLVEWFNRDGLAYEGSLLYNSIMEGYLLNVADALEGFDLIEGYDLWKNQKFVELYTGMTRLTVGGHMNPHIHEGGVPQGDAYSPNVSYMTTVFSKTGYYKLAQALYNAKGNKVTGLHADIYTKDPEEGLQKAILDAIETYGTWDLGDSDMLSGFGIAILRNGPKQYTSIADAEKFSDFWIGFGYSDISHACSESLHLDMNYRGLTLSSSMGYPTVVQGTDPERQQWVRNTVSHNTVVVNDSEQTPTDEAGVPLHFEDAGYAKVMDIQDNKAYMETDIYRRTFVAVDNGQGEHYGVDFFRVLGGSEHVYSFHAMSDVDPETTGLDFVYQAMGTYEGPDSPYGDGRKEEGVNCSSGYTWLDDVYRDGAPDTTFTVDWQVKDFRDHLPNSDGIHLKLHMMSEEPMTEVALANGYVPNRVENQMIPHVEYMLVRRSGTDGMDSLFTTVIEPYQHQSYVASSELVSVELLEGIEDINDRAAAVKVTMKNGRVDYVVYATNPDCLYRVADLFDFMGFTGVVSYEGNVITHAWGSEASVVTDRIKDAQASITGRIVDFTKDITMDGYYITVEMDEPVSAEELKDRYIFVETDGIENGAYRIYGAEVSGSTAVLSLEHQTLVREYMDKFDFSKGYRYNISEGAAYKIPLSAEADCPHQKNKVSYIANNDGTHLIVRTCTNCGEVSSTSTASCKDGTDADTKCDKCGGQIPAATQKFAIAGSNMTLGNELEVNFLFLKKNLTGTDNVAIVTHHMADGTEKVTEIAQADWGAMGTTYHKVSTRIAAKEMADTLTIEIVNADGYVVNDAYSDSARGYAGRALASDTTTDLVRIMMVDMLNYGAAAQAHFKYNTADPANNALSAEQQALATAKVACTNGQVKDATIYGSNLSLEDSILLNTFFKGLKGKDIASMYAMVNFTDIQGNAKEVRMEGSEFEKYGSSGDIYKIVVDDVVLADARQLVTVTVYNADGTVFGAGSDSMESYVARAESNNADTYGLYANIMRFATSAYNYIINR